RRFGLDPILGLIPGFGDLVAPLFAVMILFHAWELRVPKVVQARMLLNAGIDAVIGAVPIVGDLFDFAWKANERNLLLLEHHAFEGRLPLFGGWLFVLLTLASVALLAALPIVIVIWLAAFSWGVVSRHI